MKHLKKFNEELRPETYMAAGKGLLNKGHKERADKLISYGMSKVTDDVEFNFWYNSANNSFHGFWDYELGAFKDKEGGVGVVYPRGNNLFYSVDGRIYPRFSQSNHQRDSKVYVRTRQEASKLFAFLKSQNKISKLSGNAYKMDPNTSVNDLYRETPIETPDTNPVQQRTPEMDRTNFEDPGNSSGGFIDSAKGAVKGFIKNFGKYDPHNNFPRFGK